MCFVDCFFFFFKQKTAYEMRISDWSSDVCSSDLLVFALKLLVPRGRPAALAAFALAAVLLVQPFWIFNYCALFAIGVGFREIARSESRAAWWPRWHEPLGLSLILAGAEIGRAHV